MLAAWHGLRTQLHINAFILFPWDMKWKKILWIILPLILWAGGNFHAGKYFVLKLLMLLLGSIILQLQWDSGCANQPSLLTHTVQTMWWATIDAGLHDWIVWTNVSQGDRVLTVCPWEVHACNMSQDQSLLHKCAWTDGDFKNRSHWNLSNMSDKSLMWTEVPHKRPL